MLFGLIFGQTSFTPIELPLEFKWIFYLRAHNSQLDEMQHEKKNTHAGKCDLCWLWIVIRIRNKQLYAF